LTACSSDVYYDAPNENITESNVTIGNDPAAQAHRITFFGNQKTRTTTENRLTLLKSLDSSIGIPTEPESSYYTDYPELSSQNSNDFWTLKGNYKVTTTLTCNHAVEVGSDGAKIYIPSDAKLTTSLIQNNGSGILEIYVLDGGELSLNSEYPKIAKNIKIYCYGTGKLTFPNYKQESWNKFEMEAGSEFISENDINMPYIKFQLNTGLTKLASKGSITANNIDVQKNSSLLAKGDISATFLECESGSTIMTNGSIMIDTNGSDPGWDGCVVACGIDCDKTLEIGQGTIYTSYVKCPDILLNGAGYIQLDNNGLIDARKATGATDNGKIWFNNPNSKVIVEQGEGNRAAIVTDEFKSDGIDYPKDQIGVGVYLVANRFNVNNTDITDFSTLNLWYTDNSINVYIPSITATEDNSNVCTHPGYGTPSDNPDPTPPSIDPIAIIEVPKAPGSHTHNHLSATCVKDVNGRAYVSYHLNAEYEDNKGWADTSEHMGCVEIYDVDENQAQITSWLMNQDFDFNHLLVDDNKVYTVGDTKKFGATLGLINLGNNGNFGQYEMDTEGREGIMTYYKLYGDKEQKGSSGNCIIRDNNTFRIASYNGFQSFGVNDLTKQTDFISTPGSAKHVAKGGNYIVTLNLDQKKVEASTATVTVYSTWGTPITTFQTHELITPIDGKNVIATDGTYIYVALGEKGVDKYEINDPKNVVNYCWITEKQKEDPLYTSKPLANGLCVDDNYVYVANGAAGMIVLDKSTMKRVARYVRSTQIEENGEMRNFSANYVQKVTRNGVDYLYIAYGRNGLEVVKMTAPAK